MEKYEKLLFSYFFFLVQSQGGTLFLFFLKRKIIIHDNEENRVVEQRKRHNIWQLLTPRSLSLYFMGCAPQKKKTQEKLATIKISRGGCGGAKVANIFFSLLLGLVVAVVVGRE